MPVLRLVLLLWLLPAAAAAAAAPAPSASPAPPAAPDLLELALELNLVPEPELDREAARAAFAELERQARAALADCRSPAEKIAALNRVVLTGRQVSYLSRLSWRDATLAAALLRRQGNCLATTVLYVILARRLDLPVRAVLRPSHAHARWDEGPTRSNIETTVGGEARTEEEYAARPGMDFAPEDAGPLGYGRALADAEFAGLLCLEAADAARRAGDAARAGELNARARAFWPGSARAELQRLELLYQDPGRRAEVRAAREALARGHPAGEVGALARLALAGERQDQGRHQEALALLNEALALGPASLRPAALSALSSSYRTLRRFAEALEAERQAAYLLLEQGEVFADLALTNLAIMYKNAGQLPAAIAALRAAARANPENWDTRLILAGYLIRSGAEQEGWELFRAIAPPRENLEHYHTNLAWFYGSLGRKEEFLRHLGRALELARDPGILNYLETEVDFDQYRADPAFRALIGRHRARLGGAGGAAAR